MSVHACRREIKPFKEVMSDLWGSSRQWNAACLFKLSSIWHLHSLLKLFSVLWCPTQPSMSTPALLWSWCCPVSQKQSVSTHEKPAQTKVYGTGQQQSHDCSEIAHFNKNSFILLMCTFLLVCLKVMCVIYVWIVRNSMINYAENMFVLSKKCWIYACV